MFINTIYCFYVSTSIDINCRISSPVAWWDASRGMRHVCDYDDDDDDDNGHSSIKTWSHANHVHGTITS